MISFMYNVCLKWEESMILVKERLLFFIFLCLYSVCFVVLILYWIYNENIIHNTGEILEAQKAFAGDNGQDKHESIHIEIWGKASISLYLWKHILKGQIMSQHDGFMNVGNLTINKFKLFFKNGPGFIQTTVPQSVKYLVLVLNGRTPYNVNKSEQWLRYLKKLKYLKKVCVIMLGNEQCQNEWILPYMASRGGIINAAFIVYDSVLVDNKEIFQWPLGVAEYRGFPDVGERSIDLLNKRPYIANFVGTVYKNSSREILISIIKKHKLKNKINLIERHEWVPNETRESSQQYVEAIRSSDLTLSPVGMNTECYRIYEALALGSMPVVENVITPGVCDQGSPAPLRLLKHHQAPVLWVSNWTQLTKILHRENSLTFKQLTDRRIKVLNWYKRFKKNMRVLFLSVLQNKFLN